MLDRLVRSSNSYRSDRTQARLSAVPRIPDSRISLVQLVQKVYLARWGGSLPGFTDFGRRSGVCFLYMLLSNTFLLTYQRYWRPLWSLWLQPARTLTCSHHQRLAGSASSFCLTAFQFSSFCSYLLSTLVLFSLSFRV